MIKKDDEAAHAPDPVERYETSVATARDHAQIEAGDAPRPFGPERKKAAPRWRAPQLATLTEAAPVADATRWHELKFDGYRALVALGKGGARIHTRNGHDWSDRFAPLLPAVEELPARTALIDGEIVAGAGLAGFSTLQEAIRLGGPFTFYAFDLLHRDGADLSRKPLSERRKALEDVLSDAPPLGLIQPSPVIAGDPEAPFEAICAAGGEGLISKRIDAPYRGGRSTLWLKIKCERRSEFVIAGWQPSDKKGRPFASLVLATQDGRDMTYRGKVGTGFDGAAMDRLMAAMAPLERKTAPVEAPKSEVRGVRWITPRLVAEVKFAEMTADGILRHAVFIDLREDKPARTVSVERPMAEDRRMVAGVAVSSGDRIVFPKPKVTKLDVAEYYAAVADRMLEETADRPLSLVRLPEGLEGERFFQKHAGKGFPDAIREVPIAEKDGGTERYMYVRDAAGLVGAAQMGTIEFHVWGSRRDKLEQPDRMVFDLDPDEGLGFAAVKRGAVHLRGVLSELGLECWPMVTGGKGVHLVVPLRRTAGWPTVKGFAQALSVALAAREPKMFVATMSKAKRKGVIFLDWLRNERGATAIAPFSLRARPGAPVAVPVSWDELSGLRRANAFDIRSARDRGWDGIDRPKPQALSAAVIEALDTYATR